MKRMQDGGETGKAARAADAPARWKGGKVRHITDKTEQKGTHTTLTPPPSIAATRVAKRRRCAIPPRRCAASSLVPVSEA